MKTQRLFEEQTDRYAFDFGVCSPSKGWAQLDTSQDASYFGNWVNPTRLMVTGYAEGDITIRTYDTPAEFCEGLRVTIAWYAANDPRPARLDCLGSASIEQEFRTLGLGDLL